MPSLNRPIRVLIVEDNKEHTALLEHLLNLSEHPKFTVSTATTLADGIAKARPGAVDIVLLDVGLPDSEGLNTFLRFNAAEPALPIVLLSGISDLTLAIEMVQRGAQDYLVKGHVDTHLLLRSIQYAIERKRSQVAMLQLNTELENRVRERTVELASANTSLEREIAERRHAEEQLARSNRQLTVALAELRSSQRRTGSGRSAAANRELEDILKKIQQHSELLLRAPVAAANPEKAAGHLRQIATAAESGMKLIRQPADVAETAETACVDDFAETGKAALDVIAEQAVADCSAKMDGQKKGESRIAFQCKTEKGLEIEGDPGQLRSLLDHLLQNSVNAIPRRGKVTLTVNRQNGSASISVVDDGLGLSETTRQKLLSPATCGGHPDGRQSGFGIIHEVAARHGGKIEIETRKGIGTTVRVIFPLSGVPAPAPRPRRVLVADDDAMVREVISTYLIEDGYAVELAVDGRDALEKFDANPFDIVLTDRSMPEVGGDELAREVKKRNSSVPVILLTGFGDIMAAAGEKPEGVDIVMNKPFTMAGLQTTLAKFR